MGERRLPLVWMAELRPRRMGVDITHTHGVGDIYAAVDFRHHWTSMEETDKTRCEILE